MRKKFKIRGESYTEGEIVEFNGRRIPFKGIKRDHTKLTEGLWYDIEKHDFVEIKHEEINNILKNFLSDNKGVKGKFSSVKMKESIINLKDNKKKNNNERLSSDEILIFEIKDDDDLMVQTLKREINKAKLTLKEVLENLENGYNLVYGLRIRNTTKFKSMQAWANLLGKEIKIEMF